MNSTLKSLVFWMVLIVVGGLVWKFSSSFQAPPEVMTFSDFMQAVGNEDIGSVTITGNDITGATKANQTFRVVVPEQYEGLANEVL